MATTPERTDDNVNKKEGEEEAKNLQSSSTDTEQGDKKAEKIDDTNQTDKTDTLSTVQSTDEDKKSDQTSPISDTTNEEKTTVETTTTSTIDNNVKTEETTVASSSSNNNEDDSKNDQSATLDDKNKKEESISQLATSSSNKNNEFPIEKDDEQHLTAFQRQKAKYFFNINLDIENKEYVTWEDVEFYLLFHITAAGKEGSNGGDLEARLSRAARAFWEHVHDQIPLPDGKRDTLTLNQFLDAWASLIDYIVQTNQLPSIVQDLVKLGFELYSTENGDGKAPTIQPQAFDQLFQKMNLSRPFAVMAYKYLTDNGNTPLDADKIDSIVKAVITSSDDEHESHFLIPGFFKTIVSDDKDNKSPSPVQDKEPTTVSGKSPPPPPKPTSPPPSSGTSTPPAQPQTSQEQQKPSEQPSSSQSQQQNGSSSSSPPPSPAQEKKPDSPQPTQKQSSSTSQNGVSKPSTTAPSANQKQNAPTASPTSQNAVIQQEDDGIRHLLRYYHIDDGDIVEVAGGSVQRLVLVHPERPLPSYIQQNKQLLQKLQPDFVNLSSVQQNGSVNNRKTSLDTKPKVTLEERVSRGEAQQGPTVPLRQEQKPENSSSTGVRQVYPQLSAAQQEEQQKQAKLQATQPVKVEKQTEDETSTVNDPASSSSKQTDTKQTKDVSRDEEEKIIAAVLKHLGPIVEKRVAAELRRLQSGGTDEDEDIIPFPFMLGGGFPFFAAPQGAGGQQTSHQNGGRQGQQQGNIPRGVDFGGLPPGAGLFPPQLLMAMMNDLAQGGMAGEISGFPPNMPPPPHGPSGVGGVMMFVDDDQLSGGPPRSGPRF